MHVPTEVDPAAWLGQRSVLRVPPADIAVHPHQTRPAHRIPAASFVLDLIQLTHPSLPVRAAKAARLRATVRAARVVFTISSAVRDELVSDLGVDPADVIVVELPVDGESAGRVAARRTSGGPGEGYLLCLGRFDRHKNLPGLIEAFSRTGFAAEGGQLRLVGGTRSELAGLGVADLPPGVEVLGPLGASGLEDAMAGATALVQASFAEGFGLPVAEALLASVPVVSSPVPAATEFGPQGLPTFDPRSVPAMTEAIDGVVALVKEGRYWAGVDRQAWIARRPTAHSFAERVVDGLGRATGRAGVG